VSNPTLAPTDLVEHLLKHLLLLEPLAPRRLKVALKLPIVWQLQEVCNNKSEIVEPSIYYLVIGVREEWISRDPKTLVTYLSNVDVDQPLWRAEPRLRNCETCVSESLRQECEQIF
jgi:hypothetical protein